MKSTQRIALLLAIVFLLPALFFSVFQVSRLDNDEKMIQDIYQRQLDAILFSVNQYSDDIVGSWISRIETNLSTPASPDSIPEKINSLLMLNSSVKGVFVIDTINNISSLKTYSLELKPGDAVWKVTRETLSQDQEKIAQLSSFRRSGFMKLERVPLVANNDPDLQCLLFINQATNNSFRVAGLLIDPELFIENIVGPRLQSIARDQFELSAIHKGDSAVAYSTSETNYGRRNSARALTKDFWIFPDYTLGISPLGTTLEQLSKERTRNNLIILVALDAIIILGIALVFRNLKREVDLAQNKADFVSNVSHEIRTPLALISMFAETLEMGRVKNEAKRQEYYQIISKESQRLSGIVNKILNFSQTEARKKVFHAERLDLNEQVDSILKTYDFHLSNKGFEYQFTHNGAVIVHADREAVIESVINLIDNAIKYSEDKKRIEITTGKQDGFGYVQVKDYGIGISKKDQKHIFNKFYRVPSGNLAKTRGTGLGLSLVKQLIEAQKGKISVKSEPGEGSVFTLYFPVEN